MAHVTKISAGGMRGLSNHVERKTENHKNKLIDPTKASLNYSLDTNIDPMVYYQKRLDEVRINQHRDDIKVGASWVITQPRDITPKESKKFFETAHDFLAKRYGENNVVWSRVHMDETTPHLHFCFMPITPDKKHDGQEKLCAKDVLNRKELQSFHGDLSAEMKRAFGRDIGIETGQTENNLELEKLKVKTALENTAKSMDKSLYEKRNEQRELVLKTHNQTNELSAVEEKLKYTNNARGVSQELSNNILEKGTSKKAWILGKNEVIVSKGIIEKVQACLQFVTSQDNVIDGLKKIIAQTKALLEAEKDRASKAELQRDITANERGRERQETAAARSEVVELKKVLEVVQRHDPDAIPRALEKERDRNRGRGFSR